MLPLELHRPAPLAFLKGRSFLSTGDMSGGEFRQLLDAALAAKQEKAGANLGRPLAGKTVGLIFFNPSLRTRVSMTVAIQQLGGSAIPLEIGAGTWDLEHRDGVVMDGMKVEHVREAVPVLCQYVDALAVRCFPGLKSWEDDLLDPVLAAFAKHATVPVINLESAMYHPCQALADMMTIQETSPGGFRGRKVSLVWANHPKALPLAVPQSFALAAAQCGVDLTIAAPKEYMFGDDTLANWGETALAAGGSLQAVYDRAPAFDGAHVIYAKSWSSPKFYGKPELDLPLRAKYQHWQVVEEEMQRTDDGVFMHCLPVRRNVVVSDGVLDGPHSVVVRQAANRLHAQKALLAGIFA